MAEGHFIRVIKRKEVLTLAFGAMIGWGWVVLTGGWIESAGAAGAMIAFLIGGIAVFECLAGFRGHPAAVDEVQEGHSHGSVLTLIGR